MNFYFIKMGWVENVHFHANGEPDFYTIANLLFRQPVYTVLYMLFFVVLGFHLNQAFQAAFQTLGLSHPTYNLCLRRFGLIYAIVVPLGFIIIPLFILFIR